MRSSFRSMDKLLAALFLVACVSSVSARLAVMSIDLGGEFLKVAIVKPGVPMEIVLNKDSSRKTQTMVAFRDGERQFANEAQSTAVKFPPKAICYLNHVIGRHFEDPHVQLYRERFPYFNLIKDEERGTVLFKIDDETTYSPEEILGMIIEKAKEYAQDFAEQEIKDAVITVPSFYNQAERRAVLQAASLVGVNVLQLMSDNAAVALNYGVFRRKNFNTTMQYYMFYNMGATSTTATVVGYNVVKTKEGGFMESNPQLTIKGVGFDRTLGGLEFTLRLRKHLAQVFDSQKKTSLKVGENNRAMAKLFKEAERVKKVLSANTDHTAQIEGLLDEKDFRSHVTRAELEEMTSDLLDRVMKPVREALAVSEITLPEISEVILMGGATRMPKIQELLMKFVGRSELGKSINTDEAAAMGAVYQAAYLGKGFKVKKFGVRDGNIYPINVEFEKQKSEESSSDDSPPKTIKRTLFGRMNPYPQKKVMTFNRHTHDFGFNVMYSNLDFLTEDDRKSFGTPLISEYKLEGVAEALEKNKDTESKGIKAHFRMDDSGILTLDRVESVFEKNASTEAEPEKSAWSKIGSALGGLFGGSPGEEDSKVEESTEEDSKSTQPPADEKSETSEGKDSGTKQEQEDKPSPQQEEQSSSDDKKEEEEEEAEKDTTEGEKDTTEGEKKDTTEGEKKEESDKKDEQEDSSKKDDSEEKKEEGEGKKESTDKDSEKGSEKAESSKDAKNDTKKEEAKKEVPKVTTVREEIKSQHEVKDVVDISAENVKKAKKRLSDLKAADQEKSELEKAKNELESMIFDFQDKLSNDEGLVFKCASESESTKLKEQLSEISDWLYEQGDDTKRADYTAKLKLLRDSAKPILKRVAEMEERPKALDALKSVLNQTSVFLETVKNMTDLEDPIFTQVEMDTLEKLINDSREWRNKQVAAQNKLKSYEDPILLAEDIGLKIGALDREMRYLINKAKNYKPKPKPKEETKSNETKKEETKSNETKKEEKGNETTEKTTESTQEEVPPKEADTKVPGGEEETKKKEDSSEGKKRRPKSKRGTEDEKKEGEQEEILELDAAPEVEKESADKDKKETDSPTESTTEEKHIEL